MADEDKTPPETTRAKLAAASGRTAEAHALADVASVLATMADQLRDASQRYDGTAGNTRFMLRTRLATTLEEAGDACYAAASGFAVTERLTVNWAKVPWKKMALLALAGAVGTVAANVSDQTQIFGTSVQHILIAASAMLLGWAKRAPGDTKAE